MRGFRDWTRAVKLLGEYLGEDVGIAVDANGRLYCVLAGGSIGTIEGPVDVNQTDSTRSVQGTDGETLHIVSVDENGQLVMVPRGQSGNYMSVDDAGYLTAVLKALAPDESLQTIKVDSDGQLIMIPRGASGNYMDVDSDGFLSTVIKGLYGEELRTATVDKQGRIVMVIGEADDPFGLEAPIGLGQLAARLGASQRWDTRGQILWATGFEDGLPNHPPPTVANGATYAVVPGHNVTGYYSLFCDFKNFNQAAVSIVRRLTPSPISRLGCEISLSPLLTRVNCYLYITFWDGILFRKGGVLWNGYIGNLSRWHTDGSWVVTTDSVQMNQGGEHYNVIKLVVDNPSNQYERVVVNDKEYDWSSYAIQTGSTGGGGLIMVQVVFENSYQVTNWTYVDNWIVTQREPANYEE